MSNPVFFKRKRLDPHVVRRLYDAGWCDQQIADQCEISRDSVREWRRRNGLPGHTTLYKPKEEKRKPTLNEFAAEAKKLGMSYGEYMVARREGRV
jgi:uncharacterized protein YjcR